MAVGFLGMLFLFLLLACGLTIQVAGMFHAGIACASQDAHRVTPESSWVYFRRGARTKRRRISMALLGLLVLGGAFAAIFHPLHGNLVQTLHFASYPVVFGVSFLALPLMVGYLIAPRFKSSRSLTAVLVSLSMLLVIMSELALGWLLVDLPWGMMTYDQELLGPNGGLTVSTRVIPTFPHFHALIFVALALIAGRWARSQGERWFRFDT